MKNNKQVNILQVFNQLNSGGAESVIVRLGAVHSGMTHFDYAVHSTDQADYNDFVISNGSRIFVFPKFGLSSFLSFLISWNRFFSTSKGKEIAVVHGHVGSSAFFYLLIAKLHGKKTVAHSHNMYPKSLTTKDRVYKVLNWPVRFVVDGFAAPSKSAAIDRFGSKMLSRRNFLLLRNGFDIQSMMFNPETRQEIRGSLGIDDESFVIGNIGRLVEQKNQLKFLKVVAAYGKSHSDENIVAVIVGKGKLKSKLIAEAAKLNVRLIIINHSDAVQNFYSAFDAFLFTSIFEGLGNVVVEAQANGLPVISSDVIPEEAVVFENKVAIVKGDSPLSDWLEAIDLMKKTNHELLDSQQVEILEAEYGSQENRNRLDEFYADL